MNKMMNRACGALATGAVAVLVGVGAPAAHAEQQSTAPTSRSATATSSAARPDAMRPFTTSKCGSTYCVNVYGTGLHVDYETVGRVNNGAMSGYVQGQDDNDGWHLSSAYFAISSGLTRLNINHSFSNNSSFCGGVKSTPDYQDYPAMVCVTIHS